MHAHLVQISQQNHIHDQSPRATFRKIKSLARTDIDASTLKPPHVDNVHRAVKYLVYTDCQITLEYAKPKVLLEGGRICVPVYGF